MRSLASELRALVPDPEALVQCLDLFAREALWLKDRVTVLESAAAAAAATVRQKDADVRQKDADVRQKDADVRQKDADLRALNADLRRVEADATRMRADLARAQTDLMAEQGMLHMRGAIEYVEAVEAGRLNLSPSTGREQLWTSILAAHPDLAACLLRKNPTRKRPRAQAHERAALLMPALYDALRLPLHPIVSPGSVRDNGPLLISTRPANPRHAEMVACICDHYDLDFDRVSAAGQRSVGTRSGRDGLPQARPRSAAAAPPSDPEA